MIQPTGRHWCLAVLGALLIHGAAAAALLRQAPEVGAIGAGSGGIEVSLAPAAGSAPMDSQEAEAPEAEVAEVEESLADTAREAAEVLEEEKVLPADLPLEPAEAGETVADLQAVPPLPEARPRDLPRQVSEAPSAVAREQTAKLPPSSAGAAGNAGNQDAAAAGSAGSSSGGGDPGEMADYLTRLQAWLESHKEYPRHARQRRQEGTVTLYFVMDRAGRVLDYRVTESSGYDLLDRAVEEMIERAQPLPEMPAAMSQARLELRVPVQFYLR